jgi:large subunit ribosomal protein L6e
MVKTTAMSKWYKADDEKTHFTRKAVSKHNKSKLRSDIQAGSVVILLSGRFRGKRVVVLK